jgi:NAD(P)-dependent dehydrogenase (short-subunit alcohol dehydrogenase family)
MAREQFVDLLAVGLDVPVMLHAKIAVPALFSASISTSAAGRPVRRDFISATHATSYPYISPLSQDLSGRHVLITGAAWEDAAWEDAAWEDGVGYATATAFARAGASAIAVIDLHGVSAELVSRLKAAAVEAGRPEPQIIAGKVDISKLESVTAFRDVLSKAFNMATMINVSSSGALSVRKGGASYRTSKLAVLRWTEALNEEHGDEGLVAFRVNPGAIKTQMTVNEPEELRNNLPHKPEIACDTIAWLAGERRDWLGIRYVSCPWDTQDLIARKDEIIEGDKLKLRMTF